MREKAKSASTSLQIGEYHKDHFHKKIVAWIEAFSKNILTRLNFHDLKKKIVKLKSRGKKRCREN